MSKKKSQDLLNKLFMQDRLLAQKNLLIQQLERELAELRRDS